MSVSMFIYTFYNFVSSKVVFLVDLKKYFLTILFFINTIIAQN